MTLNEYQKAAAKTASGEHRQERSILGYYGELHESTGEIGDAWAAEIGDRLWYLAEICTAHGLDLEATVYCGTLAGNHGAIAEARKKFLRGDFDRYEYRRRLMRGVSFAFLSIVNDCRKHGTTWQDIAAANIAKLADRQRRGVIAGDGGTR